MQPSTSADVDGVKSTAIVKYSVPKPTQFMELKCNTDLNLPPANWLSSSVDSYGLQHVLYKEKGFSSFRMAHTFLDCIGSVDVVSDAENIKNLLKIPYHKGLISMMVHRVDNTLLLDEFDIYKHILLKAKTEWEWFKKFILENVDRDVVAYERNMFLKNKSHKALKQKSLVSKFLYHSLVQNESPPEQQNQHRNNNTQLATPLLPNPSPSTEAPDPCHDHTYNRNVVWTFEDIEMLLGTDMPIFGGGTHPCISLRLNDMSKPINVLTGIDYWLDNLMCNVPEVVMCYHLNGIVQKYELIKTEELPRLENSKFSPKLIRDVAQNILSFLKTNTTKAGHTYWLFKSKDEDVVKLYDLTSLCSEDDIIKNGQNPFTIPVAMLLYRVARNMKCSNDYKPGTIRQLLKNTVKLLQEEKYPEIVTSSHFMLSDLYIPTGTNPENPVFDEIDYEDSESIYDDDEEDLFDATAKCLYLDGDYKCEKNVKQPSPITGTVEERCLQSLFHITAGLHCLQFFNEESESEKLRKEEDNIPMAKPNEPIPMPYEKLNKDEEENVKNKKKKSKKKTKNNLNKSNKKAEHVETCEEGGGENMLDGNTNLLLPKEKGEAIPTTVSSWKGHLKSLLYEKAILVYATLAEYHYGEKNYGNSLRYLGILARCLHVREMFIKKGAPLEENCLLGRAGDCCIMIVANWDKLETIKMQFHTNLEEDQSMLTQLEKDEQYYKINIANCSMNCVLLYDILSIEQILLKGIECYTKALKYGESNSILQRLGNNYNEIGSFYLHRAKNTESDEISNDSLNKSEIYFKKGLELFEKVKDVPNIALLCTNLAHVYRYIAHMNNNPDCLSKSLSSKEKMYFENACFYYQKALDTLQDRSTNPSIWDAVHWELSTTHYNMAIIYPVVPLLDEYKEILEMFQKSLKYCDMNEDNPKFPLYQFRAAEIHKHLSVGYATIIRMYGDQVNKKLMMKSIINHRDKACKLFFELNDAYSFFQCKYIYCGLLDHLISQSTNSAYKLKTLQQQLSTLLEGLPMLKKLCDKEVDIPEEDIASFDVKEKVDASVRTINTAVLLYKDSLQCTFKALIKVLMEKPPCSKDSAKLLDVYKASYSSTFILERSPDLLSFIEKLYQVVHDIQIKINNLHSTD